MFKYYNIPDIRTLDSIIGENPTLKFSSAFNLNDPFELKFNLLLDPFAEGHREIYLNSQPNSTIEDFNEWQRQVENNSGFIWYQEQMIRNSIAQTMSLCSFAENNNNNLMWSHYTNNHRGICVEYSTNLFDYLTSINSFFAYYKVQYSEFPPSVDMFDNVESQISMMMFNKQQEWKYEQEHRVLMKSSINTDFISIESKHIKAIYIGAKAEREIINRILELCQSKEIDIYYGITLGKTYEVTFEKHKEGAIYARSFWG